jgi:hypothetical protein
MWGMLLVFLLNELSSASAEKPSPTIVDSEEKQVPFATLYTRPPDDALKMNPKHVEAW